MPVHSKTAARDALRNAVKRAGWTAGIKTEEHQRFKDLFPTGSAEVVFDALLKKGQKARTTTERKKLFGEASHLLSAMRKNPDVSKARQDVLRGHLSSARKGILKL